MPTQQRNNALLIIVVATAIVILFFLLWPASVVSKGSFGECLKEKGVTMYGVDTCSNCQTQKELLGEDFKYVDYVNCDFNKAKCVEKGIQFYPVWTKGNEVLVGVQTRESLAEFSGCELT